MLTPHLPDLTSKSHGVEITYIHASFISTHTITTLFYFPCICRGFTCTTHRLLLVSTSRNFLIKLNSPSMQKISILLSVPELCHNLRSSILARLYHSRASIRIFYPRTCCTAVLSSSLCALRVCLVLRTVHCASSSQPPVSHRHRDKRAQYEQ